MHPQIKHGNAIFSRFKGVLLAHLCSYPQRQRKRNNGQIKGQILGGQKDENV